MKVAVTDHAVSRYIERVQGAGNLDRESVREVIRSLVQEGFDTKSVTDHPTIPDRRIIPFKADKDILYLSIGPNTTSFPGDVAVIGVLFSKELGGKESMGITLGEANPQLREVAPTKKGPPKYSVIIGHGQSIEHYRPQDDAELRDLLDRRQPRPEDVLIYELQDLQIQVQYVIGKKASGK